MEQLLIATRNLHKVEEIRSMLGNAVECVCLRDMPGAPEVVEDAATFEGNARKKAETLAQWLLQVRNAECGTRNTSQEVRSAPALATGPQSDREGGMWSSIGMVLADDSGLEVDALAGAPGVQSARFAALDTGVAGNSSDAENNAKLLRLLKDVSEGKRIARFHCVLALVPVHPQSTDGKPQCFDGVCEGRIGFEPRGNHGFGYDPLFFPEGFEQSFAELGEDIKNRISHRSKALAKMADWLKRRPVG